MQDGRDVAPMIRLLSLSAEGAQPAAEEARRNALIESDVARAS